MSGKGKGIGKEKMQEVFALIEAMSKDELEELADKSLVFLDEEEESKGKQGTVGPARGYETRKTVLGLDSVENVSVGETFSVEVMPQVLFRGTHLFVDPGCAPFFDVMDLKVGRVSQFPAAGSVPSTAFSRKDDLDAQALPLELDTAQVGQKITLFVRNISSGPLRFRGVLFGIMITN